MYIYISVQDMYRYNISMKNFCSLDELTSDIIQFSEGPIVCNPGFYQVHLARIYVHENFLVKASCTEKCSQTSDIYIDQRQFEAIHLCVSE